MHSRGPTLANSALGLVGLCSKSYITFYSQLLVASPIILTILIGISSPVALIHEGCIFHISYIVLWRVHVVLSVAKVALRSEKTPFNEGGRQGGGVSSIQLSRKVPHCLLKRHILCPKYEENLPIILKLFLMLSCTYYAQN